MHEHPSISRRAARKLGGRAALRRTPLSAAVSAVLATTAVPFAALAQDPPQIEVMLVTATRRAESVQDIPINIAAFGGDMLEERGVGDLAELGRQVPGLYVVDQGKRSSNHIVVRGLNLDSISASEGIGNNGGGTVSTYVGEIPLYVDLAPVDMDRVEVLLGPQGTLYGAGTLGGAIRYIPRLPELEVSDVTFRATSFDLSESDGIGYRAGATLNLPLGDTLALRVSLEQYDDPGFIDTPFLVRESGVSDPEPDLTNPADVAANLYGDKDADGEQTMLGRIALRWQPTDSLDAVFTYHRQDMDVEGRTHNHSVAFGTDKYVSATRYPEPSERTNELLSAEFTADLGFAELTSATGFSQYEELGQRDQTDLLITLQYSYEAFPSFSAFTRENQEEETVTQEVRLVSQGDGPFSWIGGVFYMSQENDEVSREFTPHYDEYLGTDRPDNLEYIAQELEDLTEKAVFGELSFDITDAWTVTVGGRYYDYDFSTLSGAATPLFSTAVGDIGPDEIPLELEPNSQQDDGFLYKLNTSYRFTDDLMGYVTISEGYRIGSSNGVAPCPVPLPTGQIVCATPEEVQYFPDTTTNYEIGMRSQWLDRALTFNASIYYIDWQDPQLTSATASGAQPITKNGQGAETKGLELSLDAQVTDRLRLGVSITHLQAELTDPATNILRHFDTPGFGPTPPNAVFNPVFAGDRLPGSPENQGTFNVGYEMPLNGTWGLDLNYGFATIGDVITKIGNRENGETLGGYTVHHASAVFTNGPWTLGVYGQNLTNKYAVTGLRSIREFAQTVTDENGDPVRVRSYAHNVLRPREIGFRFTYSLDLDGRRN
jgi:outer membrane receptor protein involved in Fe transport